MDWSIDKAITFMNEDNAGFHKKTERRRLQLRQQLGDWSDHTQSWLAQTDIPVHLVRYEELRRDTAITLHGVLTFASLPAAEKDVNRAVKFSEFTRLRQQEERSGFAEAPTWNRGRKFFRRGEIGSWRDELSSEQIARIELRHGRMMRRLGYELSYASNLACAG